MQNNFYIYAHYTEDTNELFYIGKGRNNRYLDTRGRNNYWHKIVNKHGFRSEILIKNLDESTAFIQEILAIKEFDPKANFTKGGEGTCGYIRSLKEKADISKRMKGHKNPRFGKIGTMSGKKHTEESLNKLEFKVFSKRRGKTLKEIYSFKKANSILEKSKGKKPWNKNKTMSEPYRNKLSKSHGIDIIYVYLKKDMSFISKWENMTQCAKELGINQSNISRYLNGRNQFHKKNKNIYFFSLKEL